MLKSLPLSGVVGKIKARRARKRVYAALARELYVHDLVYRTLMEG